MESPMIEINDLDVLLSENFSQYHFSDLEFLDRGGQKSVYKCLLDGEQYVIKIMEFEVENIADKSPEVTSTEDIKNEVISRASREIEIMQKCESQHLVKLGPIGLTYVEFFGKNLILYTEQLIEGESLGKIIKQRNLTELEAIDLAIDITKAINSLWGIEMVHRDIKPQNIMMTPNCNFILLDAGIAFDTAGESLTQTFYQVGTPIYMSPEQIENKKSILDFRSDLFLLGLVIYQSVTGVHPFYKRGMNSVQIANNIVRATPKKFNQYNISINKKFERLIYRLLSYQPHLRFRSCNSLLDKLIDIREEL